MKTPDSNCNEHSSCSATSGPKSSVRVFDARRINVSRRRAPIGFSHSLLNLCTGTRYRSMHRRGGGHNVIATDYIVRKQEHAIAYNGCAMNCRTAFVLILIAGFGLTLPPPAAAQDLPAGPIHLWVGFPPGSNADLTARVLAEALTSCIDRAINVETRPGRSGLDMAEALARSVLLERRLALHRQHWWWLGIRPRAPPSTCEPTLRRSACLPPSRW